MQPLQTDSHDTAWKRFLHRRGLTKGDLVITAGGLGLAFACAVFPWYVFFNQEHFGPREMRVYRNPSDPWDTWNGRGRKPKWVQKWLAEGRSLEELEAKDGDEKRGSGSGPG